MNTWGIPNRTNNMTRSCFSSFLYICIFLTYFFKESTVVTTEKQKAKQIQQKIYRHVEGKPLPIVFDYVLPIRQSSPFSFFLSQLILKLYPYLVPFTIKGRELTRSFSYLFTFFLLLLLAKNKSLSSSSLKWIYKFKQICFPPKLAVNEQLQKCFFG